MHLDFGVVDLAAADGPTGLADQPSSCLRGTPCWANGVDSKRLDRSPAPGPGDHRLPVSSGFAPSPAGAASRRSALRECRGFRRQTLPTPLRRGWNAFWDAVSGLVFVPEDVRFTGCELLAERVPGGAMMLSDCLERYRALYRPGSSGGVPVAVTFARPYWQISAAGGAGAGPAPQQVLESFEDLVDGQADVWLLGRAA